MNYDEAKKYYEANFNPKSAKIRLANWLEDNPQAPKAKKAEVKEEE